MAENPPAASTSPREAIRDRLGELRDLVDDLPDEEAEAARAHVDDIQDALRELAGSRDHEADLEEDLEREAERLEKLWNAYVVQEREVQALEDRVAELEEALEDRDGTIRDLEEELQDRQDRVAELQEELGDRETRIQALEEEREALRELETYRDEAEELEERYEEERERLAKLYVAYQDLEDELEDVRDKLEQGTPPEVPDDVDAGDA